MWWTPGADLLRWPAGQDRGGVGSGVAMWLHCSLAVASFFMALQWPNKYIWIANGSLRAILRSRNKPKPRHMQHICFHPSGGQWAEDHQDALSRFNTQGEAQVLSPYPPPQCL